MIEAISIYLIATGEIVYTDEMTDGVAPALDVSLGYVLGDYDGHTTYVVAGVATDRPVLVEDGTEVFLKLDDGTTATTYTLALVAGTTVTYDGIDTVSVGSETLQVKGSIRGEFTFHIVPPWPHQEAFLKVSIDAV